MRSRLVLGRAASPGNSGAPFGSVATPVAVRRSARAAIVLPASPGVPEVVRGVRDEAAEAWSAGRKRELVRVVQVGQVVCGDTRVVAVSLRDGNEDRLDERLAHPLNLDERCAPLVVVVVVVPVEVLLAAGRAPEADRRVVPEIRAHSISTALNRASRNLDHERRDVEPAEGIETAPRTARPADDRSAVEGPQNGRCR